MNVTVVDYGLGNIGSIVNMVKKCGGNAVVASSPEGIMEAERIILPGVGAFDRGMNHIVGHGLLESLTHKAMSEKVPFLGICLGMQLLTKSSEEGKMQGLGFVDAQCTRFDLGSGFRVPHMGWNEVQQTKTSKYHNLNDAESRFYFVHSYHVTCNNQDDILYQCNYGIDFCAAFEHENIIGVQFHPEKSHKFGKDLISGFLTR
jgi:imidazole glycerol-phosphate synthase subunit HisH